MTLTRWRVERDGKIWGHDGKQILGNDLAELVILYTGERRVTGEGRPYTVHPDDPDAVFRLFCDEVYPGDWVYADVTLWEHDEHGPKSDPHTCT